MENNNWDGSWKSNSLWYTLYECYNALKNWEKISTHRFDSYATGLLEDIEKKIMFLTDYLTEEGIDPDDYSDLDKLFDEDVE